LEMVIQGKRCQRHPPSPPKGLDFRVEAA